jgi:multiple sugar transport system ATP-binding protein
VEPRVKQQGVTFTARAVMVESLGPDKYAHLALDGEQASTAELEKLAAETGTADVPGATHLVTRLSGAAAATQGKKVHVWFDPDHVQVFDPADGRNLTPAPGTPHATQVHRLGAGIPG